MPIHSNIFDFHEKDGVLTLAFPCFSEIPWLRHGFSTRKGGVSEGIYASMNLSFSVGDDPEKVRENYHRIGKALGMEDTRMVLSAQDHHTEIRTVTEADCGKGVYRDRDYESVDGLITNTPEIPLVTHYADCVPLFFVDPKKRVIGLAHAGWRGTVARIGEKMVRRFEAEFGSDPKDLIAAIGPSIGPCSFEVDAPVAEAFLALSDLEPKGFVRPMENGKYMVDLWETNRRIMCAAGIPAEQITVTDLCTMCHPDVFFSHRATGGKRGGMGAFMMMTDK